MNIKSTLNHFDLPFLVGFQKIRINGRGAVTPVATAPELVSLVWDLPGKAAKEFRRTSAHLICRYLGGDLTLIQEIETRYQQIGPEEKQFYNQNTEHPPEYYALEMRKLDIEEKRMIFDERRYLPELALRIECLTPADKHWQTEFLRNHANLLAGPQQVQPGILHDAQSLCRKYGIHANRSRVLGVFLAKEYRSKYNRNPMQRKTEYHGHTIDVNVYSNMEITEMEDAISGVIETL